MPDDQNPAVTPDSGNRSFPVRPTMTDDEIRDVFRTAYFAFQDEARLNFLSSPGEKNLDTFKAELNDAFVTENEDFRPRFERLRAEVVNEVAPKLMPDSGELAGYMRLPYNMTQPEPTPTSQSVASYADPVQLFNGSFLYHTTDFQISGAGFDLAMVRTYSQLSSYLGPLGSNWDHSYNLWLRVTPDSKTIYRSTGALDEETFTKHEQFDYWIPPDGSNGVLQESGDSFVLRLPHGARVLYQPHPELQPFVHIAARIEDRFGNGIDFEYVDAHLTRLRVNHPDRVVEFQYDSQDRIIAIRDYTDRTWRYDYDDLNNLQAVTTPSTPEYKSGLTTIYEYAGPLMADPNLEHNLTRIIDAGGQMYLENEYGTEPNLVSYRRVVRQRQGSGDVLFDYADVVQEFEFSYSDRERPIRQAIVIERDGSQHRYLFNRFGNMIFREEYARIGGLPKLISRHYRYNRDGNLIGTISPLGVITQALYERDLYERRFPQDDGAPPETDSNLTQTARLQFDNVLATVKRGRYYDVLSLNQSRGLWSSGILPDIFDTDQDDVIQKFTYEPDFAQPLMISDPRVTRSADPAFAEGADYARQLTRFSYSPGHGSQHFLVESVELPAAALPDGTPSQPLQARFAEYDDRGRKVRIISPNGLQTVNTYAGSAEGVLEGFIKSTTFDPGGFNVTNGVERDSLGRATRVFQPPFFDSPGDRFFSTFTYNALSQVVESTSTAPFSTTTRYRYNRAGKPSRLDVELKDENNAPAGSVVTVDAYDQELNLIAETVGDGGGQALKQNKVVFDRASRPFLFIGPSGRKRKIFFNERLLVSRTVEDYGGVHAITRSFYDADGRPVLTLDPRGSFTRLAYDALGRLVDTQDAQGNRVIRHFDKLGNLLVECRYEKADADQFRLLARRKFTYDELGRLIVAGVNRFENLPSVAAAQLFQAFQSSDPGQLLTIQSFYDDAGNLVKQLDHDGRAFLSEYDVLRRVTRKVDPDGNEMRLEYDKEGNVLRVNRTELIRDPLTNAVTGARHFAEEFAYDELNRLVERKAVTGTLRNRYDSRGNTVEVEDPLGNRSRNRYDVFGRLLENEQFLKRQPADTPVPVRTSFTYDLEDQRTSHTDALGRVTRFVYDTAGRAIATVLPDGSSDASTYDQAGNLTGYGDRNGLMRNIEWDELNRPKLLQVDTTAIAPGTEFAGATAYRAEYDGLGRFRSVENDFVVNRYNYNSLDQVLGETTSFTAVTGLDPAREFVLARSFSNSGMLAGLTYPSGREIRYEHDVLNRVVSVQQIAKGSGYPGDPATPDQFAIAGIQYEGLQTRRVARGNETSTAFQYDFSGRTVEMKHTHGADSVLGIQVLHDALGNARQRSETSPDFQSTERFDFDSLSRLFAARRADTAALLDLSSIGPPSAPLPYPLPYRQPEIDALLSTGAAPHSNIYDYDAVGNRASRSLDGVSENYVTNERDEYTQVDGVALRYDPNGNLVEDARFRYAYDHRNQLARIVRKADGHQTDLLLDYFGRSCIQKETAQLQVTVYEGRNVLEQYSDGQLRRSVVSNTEQDGILVTASNGSDLYLLTDLTGSARYVYDTTVMRNFYVYDEFGGLRQSLNPVNDDNIFHFACKRLLGDTGKYDFYFRTYDPAHGRFLQRDPKGYVDGSNPYLYGKDNPLLFRDPDGLESRPEQTINSGLYTARAVSTPLDRAGKPLIGPYNLWSGQTSKGLLGEGLARGAPGWIMEKTPQHAEAEALENAFLAKNPGPQLPRDVFEDIWVRRSITVARKAVLSGKPVASWGLDTHPNPSGTVQVQNEIPTVQRWGPVSALGMKAGALLNIWAAAHVDNPWVKGIGLTAGVAESFGATLYFGGSLTQETAMMALGSSFVRYGGGIGLTVVSGYTFIGDVRRGNVGDAVGSGSNTATGITMLVTTNPIALVATGTFAVSYNASRWIRKETGWGDASGKAGVAVANKIMGDDPGTARAAFAYGIGFAVTAGGVVVVEPAVWAGKKIGRAASWAYGGITDLIGYEIDW